MKLGAENRRKTYIALGLAVVALLLFVRMISSSGSGPAARASANPSASAEPTAAPAANPKAQARRNPNTSRREKTLAAVLKPSLDPRLRLDLLKSSEDVEYKGTGRDIFTGESEVIPQPVGNGRLDKNAKKDPPPVIVPPGPPPPPPINLKFYGYATGKGSRKSIFLSQTDGTVFTAREGDIIGGRYRVVKINATSVEIQDVLSNHTQTIPLTQG